MSLSSPQPHSPAYQKIIQSQMKELFIYLRQSFILNFAFSLFTHHYLLLVVLALTYGQTQQKLSPLVTVLLMPMAGMECLKGIGLFLYKVIIAPKVMRKKSVMDINVWHLVVLGFVNAFGYMLPTLYMLKKGYISIFEYLFRSIYVDLVFTTLLSLALLGRNDLKSMKIILPVLISIFGYAFHETVYVSTQGSLSIQAFKFTSTLPTAYRLLAPSYESKYFYLYFIARLSKCFVCVASKLFILKEQARRKALMLVKNTVLRQQALIEKLQEQPILDENDGASKFTQINKRSHLKARIM